MVQHKFLHFVITLYTTEIVLTAVLFKFLAIVPSQGNLNQNGVLLYINDGCFSSMSHTSMQGK